MIKETLNSINLSFWITSNVAIQSQTNQMEPLDLLMIKESFGLKEQAYFGLSIEIVWVKMTKNVLVYLELTYLSFWIFAP